MSLARHTVYNLAGQLVPLALSLLTFPLFLRLIGEARFGVMALLWLFVGYAGLFDFGVGQATARQLARSDSRPPVEQAQVLWTALLISAGLGILGALLAASSGTLFFLHYTAIEERLRAEMLAALPWAALAVPTVALASVLNGALQARSAFAEINLIFTLTNSLVLLAPLAIATTVSTDLPWLVAAVAVSRLLGLSLLFWRCWQRYLANASMVIDREDAFRLLSFGGWTTVSALAGPLLLVLDRFLIGAHLGAKAVSYYVVPFQLAERATALSSALGSALFPRFAACSVESERQDLAKHGLQVLAQWTSPLLAIGMILSGPFLSWWISPELAEQSTLIAQVLFFAFWLSSLAMVPYIKLLATGRPDLVAKCHLLQLLPYLALLLYALREWGLIGAALAFASRVVVDFMLLAHWAGVLTLAFRLLAIPAGLLLCSLWVASNDGLPTAWRWGLAFTLTSALLGWSLAQARRAPHSGRSHL